MKIYQNKFHDFTFKTVYITKGVEAKKIIDKLSFTVLYGLDIETGKKEKWAENPNAGLDPHLSRIRLIQVYVPEKESVYVFDMFTVPFSLLRVFLLKGRFVAHNAVFEIQHFAHNGLPGINAGCSMLLSQLVEGAEHSPYEPEPIDEEDDEDQTGLSRYRRRGHNLDAVVQRLFGVKVEKTQQASNWDQETLSLEQITYAGLDAVLTYKAARVLEKKLILHKMERVYKLLKEMQHVVAAMQLVGLPVDWNYHKVLIEKWNNASVTAKAKCDPFFGDTNMRSGKQMGEWLEHYLVKSPLELTSWPRTVKGSYAFSKTAIATKAHLPAIGTLLEYKKYAKLIDTYGQSLFEKKHPITGRLHTSYTLGETRTGRLSSRNPNCQNYPRDTDFRNMFCASNGWCLVVSDFSQIELRLQAELSQDPMMLDVYKTKGDIYCTMASSMYGVLVRKTDKEKRFVGKTVMLALGYGMGPNKLGMYAANAGIVKSQEFWDKAHKTYHSTFRVYSQWCGKIRLRAEKLGYIETLLGKRRKLSSDELYTRAPNTVIQGTAAELMMRAMLLCSERIKDVGELVATVHDEILLHVKETLANKAVIILSSSMNDAWAELFPRSVSVNVADAAFGKRWGETKKEL